MTHTKWIVALSFLLLAGGLLWPWWPLSLAGIMLAALSGRFAAALCIGMLVDLAYGAPVGVLHYFYVPFTLAAVVLSLLRFALVRYIRPAPPETL